MPTYVFDTDAASDILFGDPDAVRLMKRFQNDTNSRIFVSEITRIEIMSISNISESVMQAIVDLFDMFDGVLTVDEQIAISAANLRRLSNSERTICDVCGKRSGGKLKTPDAIIAATAVSEEAILITRNISDYQRLVNQGILEAMSPAIMLSILETNIKGAGVSEKRD